MAFEDGGAGDLTVWANDDGSVSVDVGSRFVAVGVEDLERILDRVAADGGSIRLVGGEGRADDGDDPERDPATNAASYVLTLAYRLGIPVSRAE